MGVMKKTTGLAMAIAAASLVGCANTAPTTSTSSAEMVHCYGVTACKGHNDCKVASNACKGHNDCKTADNACKGQASCKTAGNACKGQASCKGQGFAKMSAEACTDAGGTAGK